MCKTPLLVCLQEVYGPWWLVFIFLVLAILGAVFCANHRKKHNAEAQSGGAPAAAPNSGGGPSGYKPGGASAV